MGPDLRQRRFWVNHALLPLLAWGVAVWAFEHSDWDLLLSDPFYDPARGGWFLKKNWLADAVIHQGGHALILALGIGALLFWAGCCLRGGGESWRRGMLYLALCIALGTGLTALGKATINRHSPWDYDRYGGKIPYSRLFDATRPGDPAGHGFPAGHASGGFALMGCYFIFYRRDSRRAIAGLLVGMATGSVFAIGQQVRGAHFASHNLWTIMICWTVSLLLFAGVFKGRLLAGQPADEDQGSPEADGARGGVVAYQARGQSDRRKALAPRGSAAAAATLSTREDRR